MGEAAEMLPPGTQVMPAEANSTLPPVCLLLTPQKATIPVRPPEVAFPEICVLSREAAAVSEHSKKRRCPLFPN